MDVMRVERRSIHVDPDRQREEYGDVTGLAASIKEHGLLQPVVVADETVDDGEPHYRLIAGGRRLRAMDTLAWEFIPAVLLDNLPKHQRELLELEENIRRKNLEWPEEVTAIGRYVTVAMLDGLPQKEVARRLQIAETTLSKMCQLALALQANPKLKQASSWSSAYTTLSIEQKKKEDDFLEGILADADADNLSETPTATDDVADGVSADEHAADESAPKVAARSGVGGPASARSVGVGVPASSMAFAQQLDFREWVTAYTGKRFNLIHVDFPYGLNMDTANLQGSANRWDATDGRYSDSPELFESLLRNFIKHRDRFIADSAHIIFWTAHKHLAWVQRMFDAAGFWVCEVPLIWHKSDNSGIAPDVRRQPRRTYEIAVFASRGDRQICKVKSASFASPTTKDHHLSEKPLPVVTHFLEMICDGHSEVFDPTCGSGTALEAAIRLGANRVLGLDVLPQHVEHTNKRCYTAARARGGLAGGAAGNEDAGGERGAAGASEESFDLDLADLE